jgi:hypothetical protein
MNCYVVEEECGDRDQDQEDGEDQDQDQEMKPSVVVVKKRGRKSKQAQLETQNVAMPPDVIAKKRGRKPKGGKIVISATSNPNIIENKPNIILHLKCSSKDLINNVSTNDTLDIESYNFSSKNELSYEIIATPIDPPVVEPVDEPQNDVRSSSINKDVCIKLKRLEHILHTNHVLDKRSACFWCTHEFDNHAVYIPKHFIGTTYHVYGCFCSPECGVAYLMNENIDSSAKFERYQFMNNMYGKIFNYEKNIKPAPNPHYMLEKFCGNLSIQEYRSLLRNERLFMIVDKPLTRILPELHEDNDDFILNTKIIPSNYQQIKKKQPKKCTKNSIVNEHFGIVS